MTSHCSITYVPLTKYYKVLFLLQSTILHTKVLGNTKYYKVLLRTTKYYSGTTMYFSGTMNYYKVLLRYHKVLQRYNSSITKYYKVLLWYYKVLFQYYKVPLQYCRMRVAGGQTQQKTEIWKHDQVSQSKELHTLQEKRSFSWRITFLPNYKDLPARSIQYTMSESGKTKWPERRFLQRPIPLKGQWRGCWLSSWRTTMGI